MVAVRKKVVIQKGGRVELESPELVEGSTAEVIVLVEQVAEPPELASLFGKAKGNFGSLADTDALIRKEREAWTS